MKDKDVITALKCCVEFQCEECPLNSHSDDPVICERRCKQESLDLITRKNAEIEKLENLVECLVDEPYDEECEDW